MKIFVSRSQDAVEVQIRHASHSVAVLLKLELAGDEKSGFTWLGFAVLRPADSGATGAVLRISDTPLVEFSAQVTYPNPSDLGEADAAALRRSWSAAKLDDPYAYRADGKSRPPWQRWADEALAHAELNSAIREVVEQISKTDPR